MAKTYEELEAEMLKQMESEETGQPVAAPKPETAAEAAPVPSEAAPVPAAQPETAKEAAPAPAETVPEEEPLDLDPPIEHLARRRLAQEQAAAEERQRAADKELAELRAEVERLKQPKAEAKPDPLGEEFFKALADTQGEDMADALRKMYAAIKQQAAPAQSPATAPAPAPATNEVPQQGQEVDTYIADTVASHPDLSYWHELYVKAEGSKTLSAAEKAKMQRPFMLAVKASNELAADRKSGLVDPLLGHWTAKPNELAGAIVSRVRQLNTPRSAAPATATTTAPAVSPPPRSLDDVGGGTTGSVTTKSRAQQAVELYQAGKDNEAEALLTNDKDRMQFDRIVFGGTGGAQ